MITPISAYDVDHYKQQITSFYTTASTNKLEKLHQAAELFLGLPYLWEALGEGPNGRYSQEPLYRTDKFDCVTYLNTVLALSQSNSFAEFTANLQQIRYVNNNIDYTERTDWFTDLEWLPKANQLNWLKNITQQFHDINQNSLAISSETVIDKPRWYEVKNFTSLRLLNTNDAEALLSELQQKGKIFSPQVSMIDYIPLTAFFNNPQFLLNQIPAASVIVFIRPNWNIRDRFASPVKSFPNGYGSNLNVSHVGLVLRSDNIPMFYHATVETKTVVKLPLMNYLEKFKDHESLKGVHIEAINLD